MSTRDRFHFETTAQRRAFRLLTLAQLVQLEEWGLGIGTPPSAKRAAMKTLDIAGSGAEITAGELIDRLRAAATESIGHDPRHTSAPQKPYMPKADDMEATA